MSMSDFPAWLRSLSAKGAKGVVNNIDARCLGRVADDIDRLRADNTRLRALLGRAESVIKGHRGVGGGAQRMSVLDEIKKELGK